MSYANQPCAAGSSTPATSEVIAPGFDMPAVNGNASIPVSSVAGMAPGGSLFIVSAGFLSIASVDDANHVTATNTGAAGNAAPATAINAGSGVTVVQSAVTTTAVAAPGFAMPSQQVPASVPLTSVAGMYPGADIYITNAGFLNIVSVDDSQHVSATSTGAPGNAAPTTPIAAGEEVSVVGSPVTFAAVRAALSLATMAVSFAGQELVDVADGAAPTSAATVGQTYYTPYAAPAGPGIVVPAIVGQNYLMGGTVAAPNANEHVLYVWPRDPAKGPFGLTFSSPLFETTRDYIMELGYNANGEAPAEPRCALAIEENYENPAGTYALEFYNQYAKPDGTSVCRPFFATMNRATYAVVTQACFGCDDISGAPAGLFRINGRSTEHAGGFDIAYFTNVDVRITTDGFAIFSETDGSGGGPQQMIGVSPNGGINIYNKYGQRLLNLSGGKQTLVGALSLVADLNAKEVLTNLIQIFTNNDMFIDGTT